MLCHYNPRPVAAYDDLAADVEQGPVEDFCLQDVRGEEDVGDVVVLVVHLPRLPSHRPCCHKVIISTKALHNGVDKLVCALEAEKNFKVLSLS